MWYLEAFWIVGMFTIILPSSVFAPLLGSILFFFILYSILSRSVVSTLLLLGGSIVSLTMGSVYIETHEQQRISQKSILQQEELQVRVIRPTKDFGYQSLTPVESIASKEKIGLLHSYTTLPIGSILTIQGEEKPLDPEESINSYIQSLDVIGLYQGTIISSSQPATTPSISIWQHIAYLREFLDSRTQKIMPGDSGAFTTGILFGIDERLTEERQDTFRTIGVTHILAISGSNVVLVIVLFQLILTKIPYLGRKRRYFITLLAIAFFIILTGAEGSIIRAGLFAIIILTAIELGRLRQATRGLLHTTVLISFFYPYTILYDVGFQLSILASLGLIWGGTYARYIPSFFGKLAWETFCAQLFVLPLLIWTFGGFSLVSFIANLIIIPILPAAMLLGALSLLPYMSPVAFTTDILNRLIFWISDLFAQVPHAYWQAGESRLLFAMIAASFAIIIPGLFHLTPKLYKLYLNR
jgi:ComEC/Rec2-related protein